jgi:hypothetical protein
MGVAVPFMQKVTVLIRDFPIMPEKLIALTVTSGGIELARLHELT